jgi:hypothetical protein
MNDLLVFLFYIGACLFGLLAIISFSIGDGNSTEMFILSLLCGIYAHIKNKLK